MMNLHRYAALSLKGRRELAAKRRTGSGTAPASRESRRSQRSATACDSSASFDSERGVPGLPAWRVAEGRLTSQWSGSRLSL